MASTFAGYRRGKEISLLVGSALLQSDLRHVRLGARAVLETLPTQSCDIKQQAIEPVRVSRATRRTARPASRPLFDDCLVDLHELATADTINVAGLDRANNPQPFDVHRQRAQSSSDGVSAVAS